MNVIIVEDETAAVQNLQFLLNKIEPDLTILEVIESVADAIDYFKTGHDYDLVFLDIHLADGNSFEILQTVKPNAPIIFTTAYDQYAIRAFKENSIDYLLKPIQRIELENALQKFKTLHSTTDNSNLQIQHLIDLLQPKPQQFRQSYLVQKGESLIPIATEHFAFFFIQNGVVRATTKEDVTYHLPGKLEDLEAELNPINFFRANRQYLISRTAIKDLSIYFNGRLIINTTPSAKEQIIVSKATTPKLKAWLSQH